MDKDPKEMRKHSMRASERRKFEAEGTKQKALEVGPHVQATARRPV